MIIYNSADTYIEGAESLREKISRIDQVIDALMSTALQSAAKAGITEYSLNDGQTVVRGIYSDVADIQASIYAFERLKQMYVSRLNGRVTRLVHNKNWQ